MSDASIRSFALEYYRKRGAAIQPVEHEGHEAYHITPRQGASLRVTFADEAPSGEGAPTTMTATSPEWRAILEDLTAEVVVSYRYLVCAPIANPARTLTQALPSGWEVNKARLKRVESRVALGLTHRVTLDASALNARREVMHHHVWDVETGNRLPAVEPLLYEAPTLLIRPRQYPSEATVRSLLNRSLLIVDADTDLRGQALEAELAAMLQEAEGRANQYYEQQMGHVLQRERLLEDRLETARTRLTEARTPDAIARWQQESASAQTQLDTARARREEALADIEAACARKLQDERERHELTALTDLVAICHASYDVITYEAEARLPDGQDTTVMLRYWPVTREIALPGCAACGEPATDARLQPDGSLLCRSCTTTCPACGDRGALAPTACSACGLTVCAGCLAPCACCGAEVCVEHLRGCSAHDTGVCESCAARPEDTGSVAEPAALPEVLAVAPAAGEAQAATSLLEGPAETAAARSVPPGDEEAAEPVVLEPTFHAEVPAHDGGLPEAGEAPAVVVSEAEETEVLVSLDTRWASSPISVGSDPEAETFPSAPEPARPATQASLLAFTASLVAQPADVPEMPTPEGLREPVAFTPSRPIDEAEEDRAVAALFVPQPAAAPASPTWNLDACPACLTPMDEAELLTCSTCGVPSCRRCINGEQAPCPACESLAPTVPSDPRLAWVLRRYPELARGSRAWEVSVLDGFVVTHWSRWGTWGMVTYRQETPEAMPVLVTAFRCGHLDTLRQVFSLRRRGA